MILDLIRQKLFMSNGGLIPHTDDERDLSFGAIFGLGTYTPKNKVVNIKTVSIKAQQPFNTCVWNAVTAQKEIDEKTKLSVRFLVALGKWRGFVSGNGFASIRNAMDLTRQYGIAEESACPDIRPDFATYASPKVLTQPILDNAKKHKTSRYFTVKSKDEWLQALDQGRAIVCGLTWRTGYQGANFVAPYTLRLGSGTVIGGHAVLCIGFNLDTGLLKFQNSFGEGVADHGCFYVKISEWFKIGSVGYVSVDMSNDTPIIASYEGKDVKSTSDPKIYRIQNGQKHWYPDERTFFSWGGRFGTDKTWQLISGSILDQIPRGEDMKAK